jgi:hypothetical protein
LLVEDDDDWPGAMQLPVYILSYEFLLFMISFVEANILLVEDFLPLLLLLT